MKPYPPPRTKKDVYKRAVRLILLDLFQSSSFEIFRIVAFWLLVGAALLLSWEVVKRIYVTPSAADRGAVTFAIQKDWQQGQEGDPQVDRLTLGFSVAVLFIDGVVESSTDAVHSSLVETATQADHRQTVQTVLRRESDRSNFLFRRAGYPPSKDVC